MTTTSSDMFSRSSMTGSPLQTFETASSYVDKKNVQSDHSSLWQRDLRNAIRSSSDLLQRLGLDEKSIDVAESPFPVMVPESFVRRMKPGDLHDPLLRQVLPTADEQKLTPGFVKDPVGDLDSNKGAGLLQKYHGRALLILNGLCAIHCRYCFRREFPYNESPKQLSEWESAFSVIESDPEISEVILSGGDPLMMSDDRLAALFRRIAEIPQVQRIRIHSRLPIVLPSRIQEKLFEAITGTRLQPIFVVHANHPRELVSDCAEALQLLVRNGIPTLNQAVLLRRINDSVAVLQELCERCINLGVIPYYLHQLDRVRGAAHFEVSEAEGLELIEELRKVLPGYAVPRYVREIPGEQSKTPLH